MQNSIDELTKKASMTVSTPEIDALAKTIKELPTYDKQIA